MNVKIFKGAARHTGIYLLFDAINKAVPFLLLPFLSHTLHSAELGKLELFNTYVALLTLVVLFGLDGWCASNFNRLNKNEFSKKIILGLKLSIAISFLAILILYLIKKEIVIILSPVYCLFMCIVQIRTLTLRLQLQTVKASLILFLNVTVSTSLTLVLFNINGGGVVGRIVALAIPLFIIGIWSLYSLREEFHTDEKLSKNELITFIHYTLPLVPNGLINFIRFGADKFFVAHFFGVVSLAIFGVGYQFAMIANIFMLSLNQAVMPFTMRWLNEKKIKTFLQFTFVILLLYSVFVMVLWFSTPHILNVFFDSKYTISQSVSSIYYLSYPMIFLSILLMNICFVRGKTKTILLSTFLSAVAHIGVLFIITHNNLSFFYVPYALLFSSGISLLFSLTMFVRLTMNAYR